jgi:acyl dehydratase
VNLNSPMSSNTYCSDWASVTQGQIDSFAAVTGDNQWIHRDNAKSAGSPFNAPIAHGLLMLSFGIRLARESGALTDTTWVLYGFDNLRFRAPVRCGARIRCLTTIRGVRKLAGKTLLHTQIAMEIEDQQIPALVADCLLLKLDADVTSTENSAPWQSIPG